MAGQRTYDDDEVRQIFAAAARQDLAEPRNASASHGLTLTELQDIGREAGLDVVQVARAAAALDAPAPIPERTSLGMPVEVLRAVPLPRAPTDTEWEQLVAELRATFRARGRILSQGGLREWRNGNLHACVEPSAAGYRLRLGTVKGNARTMNLLGGAGLLTGAMAAASAAGSGLPQDIIVPGIVAAASVATFGANLLRLPRWADTRRRQMDAIAAKVNVIMAGEPRPA